MAGVIRAKGASKSAEASLEPVRVPVAKRPMVAGEIPGYSQKFDRLWAMFPGRWRDRGDKPKAKNLVATLGLGEFATLVENWGAWCERWASFPQAETRYIPRMHNWVSRGEYKTPPLPPRKDGELYKRNAERLGPEAPIVTRRRAEIASDSQTTGEKPVEIALEDMEELAELAASLRKLAPIGQKD